MNAWRGIVSWLFILANQLNAEEEELFRSVLNLTTIENLQTMLSGFNHLQKALKNYAIYFSAGL